MLTASELRQKYLDFFQEKKHAVIPSASLVPENDPTVLFTTAGMHPLVPYLMGETHPLGKRIVNTQKCLRTGDIDEVGDNRHLTFFEMLGNWSLGDYFKEEAIAWSWEFLTDKKWLGLDPRRIYVTVFAGDQNLGIEKDEKSIGLWKKEFRKAGIEAGVCELNQRAEKDSRIFLLGKDDNFWGPAGQTGPCGPCSEMFYDVCPEEGRLVGTHEELVESFRLMEIWNDVFMEFNKKVDGSFERMKQQNVDTGMGLERTITVLSGKENVFETDLFIPLIKKIEILCAKKYSDSSQIKKSMRIIADHIKASVFLVADGVEPSNTERGYVLRRLIRRAVRQGYVLGIKKNFTQEVAKKVQEMYQEVYPEVSASNLLKRIEKEEDRFRMTLEKGLRHYELNVKKSELKIVPGNLVFNLYQTYGFPLEMTKELAEDEGKKIDMQGFKKELKKHQELSRTASAGMFKGGLADTKEKTTMLHTVAHLMLAGLRKVLGKNVHQRGSNINGERIRFDFSHPSKMTEEEKRAVENFVNEAIQAKVPVELREMSLEQARQEGAEGCFENKYGEKVKVYHIKGYSKEICGGPHVRNTGEIRGVFKIKKEESSSSGVRRIKAVIE